MSLEPGSRIGPYGGRYSDARHRGEAEQIIGSLRFAES